VEEVRHLGITFADVRLQFNPVRTDKWVNIRRLSYGIPYKGIADALKPYGKVIQINMDSFYGVYVGVLQVLMELSKSIPSRRSMLLISGLVFMLISLKRASHATRQGI
jgi:hypothetical protein